MKSLRSGKPRFFWKTIGIPALMFAAMLVVFIYGIMYFENVNTEQNLILTENAVRKATIQCYANEGFYPPNLQYIEEKYNVTIDYSKFNVTYDCAAANVMPNIAASRK